MNKLLPLVAFSVLLLAPLGAQNAFAGGPNLFIVQPSGEIATEFQGHCYAFIPNTDNWINAYNDAQTKTVNGNTGHLVSITSAAEDNHVDSVSPIQGWIGYTRDTNFPQGTLDSNNFGWITGEPAGYTNWNLGEPSGGSEQYVETHQGAGGWNDANVVSISFAGYFVEFDSCHFVDSVGGEFIQIDSTALILAGAQSTSWMIPVVLSVLGIGLVLVKRKQ